MNDIFSKQNQQKRWIAILVLINLALIAFIFMRPGKKDVRDHDADRLAELLKDELKLTEPQAEQLKTLRQDFYQLEAPLSQLIRTQRDSMNLYMFRDQADTFFVKTIAERIAQNEYNLELYRLRQSVALSGILNPSQKQRLSALMREIKDYFKPLKK